MKLKLDSSKCTGCRMCELACSANRQNVFNPSLSHIKIILNETGGTVKKSLKACSSCLLCLKACPAEAISYNGKWLDVDKDKCTGCGQCVSACPQGVIYLDKTGIAATPDFCHGSPACIAWCPHQAIIQTKGDR